MGSTCPSLVELQTIPGVGAYCMFFVVQFTMPVMENIPRDFSSGGTGRI
jgi:hypothetical protein